MVERATEIYKSSYNAYRRFLKSFTILTFKFFLKKTYEGGTTISPILEMRKLRHREGRKLLKMAQLVSVRGGNWSLEVLAPQSMPLTPTLHCVSDHGLLGLYGTCYRHNTEQSLKCFKEDRT